MLLEEKGLIYTSPEKAAYICHTCLRFLEAKRCPPLSLANGMWIGTVPDCIRILSMPERLLIAQLYPRIFVYKLYPKDRHAGHDPSTLYSGMKGSVTSYEFNQADIVDMLEGRLMPRPVDILASVLSVTFVGKGKLPKHWLLSTFRVRRKNVRDALVWLREHNPKYFGQITISDERLSTLPEDAVPDIILETIRQEEDTDQDERDRSGYVPVHDDGMRDITPRECDF
jgi:hypothetical protein